ncbi:MAG: family 16 glycoside hydrolase [Roseibacillus sp.]
MNFKSLLSASLLLSLLALHAEETRKLLFEDDFERNEASEEKEDIGKGWFTASETRAQGNKQVDLKDGTMRIYIHEVADHAVSVKHEAGFKDGAVEARFNLENPDDELGFNFADMDFKEVHAGHLFKVVINKNKIAITDLKTGIMDRKIRDMRKAGTLPADVEKMLKTKTKSFPVKIANGEWQTIAISVEGDTATVTLNNKTVGSFSSEGIAHPTKGLLRLSVPKQAVVDDLKIFSAS